MYKIIVVVSCTEPRHSDALLGKGSPKRALVVEQFCLVSLITVFNIVITCSFTHRLTCSGIVPYCVVFMNIHNVKNVHVIVNLIGLKPTRGGFFLVIKKDDDSVN